MTGNKLLVHAYDEGQVVNSHKGYFNGSEFVPNEISCNSVNELQKFDYVQFYENDRLTLHIGSKMPKNNLENRMKREFIRVYGEVEQATLF